MMPESKLPYVSPDIAALQPGSYLRSLAERVNAVSPLTHGDIKKLIDLAAAWDDLDDRIARLARENHHLSAENRDWQRKYRELANTIQLVREIKGIRE